MLGGEGGAPIVTAKVNEPAELKLVEAEHDYLRQRGLTPGQESLLLQDPAGNWVELFEVRRIA